MKKLNIKIKENADYSEVVDSIADVLEAGKIIEENLEDGFQLTDLISFIQVQPVVNEIVNDAPVFVDQFLKLNADTAKAAVVEARERIIAKGIELGKVTNKIIEFLYVSSNSYGYALETYKGGQSQYLLWQTLLNGGEVFPDKPKQ